MNIQDFNVLLWKQRVQLINLKKGPDGTNYPHQRSIRTTREGNKYQKEWRKTIFWNVEAEVFFFISIV